MYQSLAVYGDTGESLNLNSLLIQLRIQVAPKWHEFGAAIGIPEDLLQQYFSYPADECLIKYLIIGSKTITIQPGEMWLSFYMTLSFMIWQLEYYE